MKLRKIKPELGLSFSLEVFDEGNRRLERWRNMLKDLPRVISIIDEKYSLDIIKDYNKDKKKDDLSWAK